MSLLLDIASKENVENGIRTIKDRYQKPPSICVNCAGIALVANVLDCTDDHYNKLTSVNLKVSNNTCDTVHSCCYYCSYKT